MGRLIPVAAALMLAACGSSQLSPPVASAEAIDQAVTNAERELAAAKATGTQGESTGLFGA